MHNRRDFIKKTGLAGLALAAGPQGLFSQQSQARSPSQKPNIIFIMADDLGYGNLGSYGQTFFQTPHLDQMAKEGMRFTSCYAGSTVCAPSRCCLMTGMHTGHARIRGNKRHPLLPEDRTVAEYLKDLGYATGIIGKWGLAEPETTGVPNRKGFDFWYGYLNQHRAHNYYPDYLWRNEEREYFQTWTYSHDAFTKEALDFVSQNKDNPFFLYLAYTIPHAFNEGREQGMQIPSDKPYSDQQWPQQDKNFAAMVHRMDADIGHLLTLLKRLGLDENTLVFFTSDNGPHREGGHNPDTFDDNGPLRGIKRELYEGGIRVPMIARWPGTIPTGTVNKQPWAFWDVLPTAVDIAGGEPPAAVDGLSMKNTLLGQPQQSHEYFYWEFHERGFQQAVRMGNWKAVVGNDKPLELYNLKDDEGEANNVADQHPGVVAAIFKILASARTDSPHYPVEQ